ncbi:MAG: MFS transporter [Bdellovibrio sp.]|nr:MFS transporter [Bdellovibrio sp.]
MGNPPEGSHWVRESRIPRHAASHGAECLDQLMIITCYFGVFMSAQHHLDSNTHFESARWSRKEIGQILLISLIFVAACIETDIYLPAFPDMMTAFQVSEAEIQKILTWNFFALCLSGPFYGPLSDAWGRRKPLLVALLLFLVGSGVTVLSRDFGCLLFGRILQGLGSGGCFTLGAAILFDSFTPRKALVGLNHLNSIVPLAMAGAPILGGVLNQTYGYRSNFVAITAVVLLSWAFCQIFFKETLPKKQRHPIERKKLKADFSRVLSSFSFWQMNLPVCLLYSGYLGFLSVSSIYFVIELGVSKSVFPFFQTAVLSGWLVASVSCSWFLKRWGSVRTLRVGIGIFAISLLGFQLSYWLAPRNPYWLTFFMMTYSFGYNWLQTPYFGEIMGLMPDIKGIVGSIVTSFRLLLTAGLIGLVSIFYDGTLNSFALVQLGVALVVAPMIWLRERNRGESDTPCVEVQISH